MKPRIIDKWISNQVVLVYICTYIYVHIHILKHVCTVFGVCSTDLI